MSVSSIPGRHTDPVTVPAGDRAGATGRHAGATGDRAGATGCRGPGRPRNAEASRAITDAALRQLEEVGYAKLSMESVASEAGVARATVYRRYRSKADLITAAIGARVTARQSEVEASTDPKGELTRFLQEFDERFAESCFEVIGALVAAREEPEAMALHRARVVEPGISYARRILVRARDLGQIGGDADVDLALQMLAGAVFARRVSGVTEPTDWAERAVTIIWRGLARATP